MSDLSAWFEDVHPSGWTEAYTVTDGTDAWRDALEWLEFHVINPSRVPWGTCITRDAGRGRITYTRLVEDDDGKILRHQDGHPKTRIVIEQGEAPPLPLPASVVNYRDGPKNYLRNRGG